MKKRKIRVLVEMHHSYDAGRSQYTRFYLIPIHRMFASFAPFVGNFIRIIGIFSFPQKAKPHQFNRDIYHDCKEALRWIKSHGGEEVKLG